MPITEIHHPATLSEAVQLLRRPNVRSAILAGGTKLAPRRREQLAMVSLRDLGLSYIRSEGDALHVGAATPLQAIVEAGECAGILAQAARAAASLNLRNSATLGGELAAAAGNSPLLAALLALDAALIVHAPEARQLPLDSFMNYRERLLAEGALIEQVVLPLWRLVARAAFERVARTPGDAPIVCAAVSARAGIGQFTNARVAVGGVAQAAVRLLQVEQLLQGKAWTGELIEQAGELAERSVAPADDHVASAEYRRQMAGTLVRRALRALAA